jgi:hypothetical protein
VLVSTATLSALPHSWSDVPLEQPYRYDFAPHSHSVYFNTALMADPSPGFEYNLIKVDADSLALQPLLKNGQGGAELTFSPDGSRIALVADNRISVVQVDGSELKTVFTFPTVNMYNGSGYFPQVVWLPDASGFKTVIPAADALANPSAPTRFMFVPADGSRAAQLAEFISTPAFANPPRISPDGARVLYARPNGADLELHIIDASTADRAFFSCAADQCGVLGWAPDSLHVVYWLDDKRRAYLGSSDVQGIPLSDTTYAEQVTWLDTAHYLFLDGADLRIGILGQPGLLIDTADPDGFDFALMQR